MKLQVEQAKEQIGKVFPFTHIMQANEFADDVTAFPWSRHDITISGEYWYDGQHFIVQGTIEREGQYECTRCLEPVYVKDGVSFKETYGVRSYDTPDSEDDEIFYCDGVEIDLTNLIRDTLIINEPYQVLCQEDCKGLCVHCGINLNKSQCNCDSFVVDPRLAVLKTLLEKMDD